MSKEILNADLSRFLDPDNPRIQEELRDAAERDEFIKRYVNPEGLRDFTEIRDERARILDRWRQTHQNEVEVLRLFDQANERILFEGDAEKVAAAKEGLATALAGLGLKNLTLTPSLLIQLAQAESHESVDQLAAQINVPPDRVSVIDTLGIGYRYQLGLSDAQTVVNRITNILNPKVKRRPSKTG